MKEGITTTDQSTEWLRAALRLRPEESPFPWQVELLRRFRAAEAVDSLDIPTGLGKTAVIAVWLVARALGAQLPRRLVYVVDRRAVVDQATEVAESLRAWVARERTVAEALVRSGASGAQSSTSGPARIRGEEGGRDGQ